MQTEVGPSTSGVKETTPKHVSSSNSLTASLPQSFSVSSTVESLPCKNLYKTVLADILGPVKAATTRTRKRKTESACIITSSPYKKQLEEKMEESKKPQKLTQKKNGKADPAKAKTDCVKGKASVKSKVKDTTPCGICSIKYCDDDGHGSWIQCQNVECLKWFHLECQGLDESYKESIFVCISCENYDSE